VEDLDRTSLFGLVEDVVQGPDVIRVGGSDRPWGAGRLPRSPTTSGDMQALVTPEPLDPLAVARPAVPDQQHVDTSIPVAGMTPSQGLQTGPQASFVRAVDSAMALRRAA